MNKKTALIRRAISKGSFPVTDNTQTFIQIPCPSCERQMMVFHKSRLSKERIFKCICGYRLTVAEKEYEAMTGRCFVCGKRNCCASDHRFHGELIGMGF
ncbi:MAG: hypothetical protein KKE62_07420 [Proteobacteria bacterium]|nr:hypothetical protein [Pseudomonadota bacterium]MBU1389722.1 hypothetical protein [Pseudomonadota bacterium]MBU1542660.1 hypothetical protein [Pseudomonadota bacterium]MBU2480727.1 hypothetical protein [Pseudomonadota bacterium]